MKFSPKDIQKIRELIKEGKTYKEIAKKMHTSESHIQYYTFPNQREKQIQRSMKNNKIRLKKMSQEEKERYKKSRKEYFKNYFKRRYHEEPEFKKKHITNVMNYQRRVKG